ncbi:hypothetical protein ZWY2020_049803 [Hordeum vulgare]|nr:hypothetical protein ZWY2020_049803 [Hordeum vulgare]
MSSQSCGCAYPYQGVMYFRAPLFADVGNGTARRGGDVLLLPALPVSVPSFDPRHLQKRHGRTAATPAPSFRARRRQQKRPADAPGRHPALQPLHHLQPVRARLLPPLPRLRPRILPSLRGRRHGRHDRGTQVPRLPRPQVNPPLHPPRWPGRHRRRGAPLPLLLSAPRMGLFFLRQVTGAALGREGRRAAPKAILVFLHNLHLRLLQHCSRRGILRVHEHGARSLSVLAVVVLLLIRSGALPRDPPRLPSCSSSHGRWGREEEHGDGGARHLHRRWPDGGGRRRHDGDDSKQPEWMREDSRP